MECESKIDSVFATYNLVLSNYKEVYRKDRNKHGGGVFLSEEKSLPQMIKTYLTIMNVYGIPSNFYNHRNYTWTIYIDHQELN